MSINLDYSLIPRHMQQSVRDYIEKGFLSCDFLRAVLKNDLFEAVLRADWMNKHALPYYVEFLYNDAPAACWGSATKVDQWIQYHRNKPIG